MGNSSSTTSYALTADSYYTASDLLLDQMEKQTCSDQIVGFSSWMETASRYCAIVLTTIVALLTGNLSGALDQPKQAPVLVEAACQTEDGDFIELAVSRDWRPCHLDNKCEADDDSRSSTTETSELFTDDENEDYSPAYNTDESEWENMDPSSDELLNAICDACETCVGCDYETQAEHLLRLTAIVCADEDHSCPVNLEDYLCMCGECPQYKLITKDVAATTKRSPRNEQYKHSIIRLLQAFSTYNEVLGYHQDMIPTARECLKTWSGDEDKAFNSFVTIYDEVPRLCNLKTCS